MTTDNIDSTAEHWGLSRRAAERWLERGAPLERWIAVPNWHAHLSDKTGCKLTEPFLENIYAAQLLRSNPPAGTAAAAVWLAAAEQEKDLGHPVPPLPGTWTAWLEGAPPPPLANPERGVTAAKCRTLAGWVGFFCNRPLTEDDFPELFAKRGVRRSRGKRFTA